MISLVGLDPGRSRELERRDALHMCASYGDPPPALSGSRRLYLIIFNNIIILSPRDGRREVGHNW